MKNEPCWRQCTCGNFWCETHHKHAHDCECPPIDEWQVDPYLDIETTGEGHG